MQKTSSVENQKNYNLRNFKLFKIIIRENKNLISERNKKLSNKNSPGQTFQEPI